MTGLKLHYRAFIFGPHLDTFTNDPTVEEDGGDIDEASCSSHASIMDQIFHQFRASTEFLQLH